MNDWRVEEIKRLREALVDARGALIYFREATDPEQSGVAVGPARGRASAAIIKARRALERPSK